MPDAVTIAASPPLRRFIWDIQSMVELDGGEREILLIGRDLASRLLAEADWAPPEFSAPGPGGAAQYHVFADVMARFAVVLTALAPGAALAVDRPGCWEICAVAAGALARASEGGGARSLPAGAVEALSSRGAGRDVLTGGPAGALALHVYGGDIGALARRPMGEATPQPFANGPEAPPFDIFTIQTKIVD